MLATCSTFQVSSNANGPTNSLLNEPFKLSCICSNLGNMSWHCSWYLPGTCRYCHLAKLSHNRLPAQARGLRRGLAVLQVLEASAPTAPGARLFSQLAAEPSETQQLQSPAPLRPPGNWGLAAAVRPPAADQGELSAWLG